MNKLSLIILASGTLFSQTHAMQLMKSFGKQAPRIAAVSQLHTLRYTSLFAKLLNTGSQGQQKNKQDEKKCGHAKYCLIGLAATAGVCLFIEKGSEKCKEYFKNLSDGLLKLAIKNQNAKMMERALALGANINADSRYLFEIDPVGHGRQWYNNLFECAVIKAKEEGASQEIVKKFLDHKNFRIPQRFNWESLLCTRLDLYYEDEEKIKYYDQHIGEKEIADIITKLVSHGFNINEQDAYGRTPLLKAYYNRRDLSVFKAILDAKPDISLKDCYGESIEDCLNDYGTDIASTVYYKPQWVEDVRTLLEEYKQKNIIKS